MRMILRLLALGLGVCLIGLLIGLGWAHIAIRSIQPALPAATELAVEPTNGALLPVHLWYVNTASQPTTRAGVLEPSLDPNPGAPYTMSLPSFALEWADGRIFLIDLGMDREAAAEFGKPSEQLFDAAPMQPLGSVADQLGSAASRVAGVAFTHLHTDHTNGAIALCRKLGRPIPLFQGSLQEGERNYTTRPGALEVSQAGCLETQVLREEGLQPVPGFDGLWLLPVAGHTPGSQVFVARMAAEAGGRTWIFTGDVVNHIEGVERNLPKPTLYSLFVVPESPDRLDATRRLLAAAARREGTALLVSHDQNQLESSGVARWQ